ncbi:FprA family A-type flavoprotein [Enterocloster clostridioformis]|uniref:FprA family A-type flavoprotein n=3 Tax=Clostridia TaxID=186801 RepID=UPI003AB4A48E
MMYYDLSKHCSVIGKVIKKPDRSFSFLAYLLKGKNNVLIDTVPERSSELFMKELTDQLPLSSLNALILNHSENDHSGALGLLLAQKPELPIYCTPACKVRLSGDYPKANFIPVEHGSFIKLGEYTFRFIHTPGLHWEDNMVTFLEEDETLFSNDLFGQYLGAEPPVDRGFTKEEILSGVTSYFEKVFQAASAEERGILASILELPTKCIAPGHGVILEKHFETVLSFYRQECVIAI